MGKVMERCGCHLPSQVVTAVVTCQSAKTYLLSTHCMQNPGMQIKEVFLRILISHVTYRKTIFTPIDMY